jgi:hypothetical protein
MIDPADKNQAKEFLARRQAAYQRVFGGHEADAEIVLKDLALFCRALTTTFHADARIAANLDGRREVFCRIAHHRLLTPDELWDLYGSRHLKPQE